MGSMQQQTQNNVPKKHHTTSSDFSRFSRQRQVTISYNQWMRESRMWESQWAKKNEQTKL